MKPLKITEWYVNITYLIGIFAPPVLVTAIVYAWFKEGNYVIPVWPFLMIGVFFILAFSVIPIMYFDICQRNFQNGEDGFWKNVVIRLTISVPAFPVYYYAVVQEKKHGYIPNMSLLKNLRRVVLVSFYLFIFTFASSIVSAYLAALMDKGYGLPLLIISKILILIPILIVSFELFHTVCLWDYVHRDDKNTQSLIHFFGQMHLPSGAFEYYKQYIKNQNDQKD